MLRRICSAMALLALLGLVGVPPALPQGARDAAETGEQAGAGEQAQQGEEAPPEPEARKAFWDTLKAELVGSGAEERRSWVQRVRSAIIIIFLAWIAYRAAIVALRRMEKRLTQVAAGSSRVQARQKQQVATVIGLVRSIAWYAIAITAAVLLLDNVAGVNVVPLLTGAGIAGVAIAFGSQALVRDVVTGLFQLLEGQYAVGDYVQIGAAFGKVEHVGLRVTRLRDLQDKLYFIPNGTITMVTTYDEPTQDYVLQAPFSDEAQADEALEAVRELAAAVRAEFPEIVRGMREPEATTSESGLHSVKMRLKIVPTQEWLVNEELPARVKQLFAGKEVSIPEGRVPRCYADISPLARVSVKEEKRA